MFPRATLRRKTYVWRNTNASTYQEMQSKFRQYKAKLRYSFLALFEFVIRRCTETTQSCIF